MKKLIILIIVLVAAYFALDKFYPQILQKLPTTEEKRTSIISEQTTNWKTYTNAQYGFEM